MHAAQDYVAVDSGDRIVFGPTTDYREARLHADRVGGVVKFAVAAAEEVKNAKFERCVQHVKRESPSANPWAVCHSVLGEANEHDDLPPARPLKLEWYNVFLPTPSGKPYAQVVGHVQGTWLADADNKAKAQFGPDAFVRVAGRSGLEHERKPVGAAFEANEAGRWKLVHQYGTPDTTFQVEVGGRSIGEIVIQGSTEEERDGSEAALLKVSMRGRSGGWYAIRAHGPAIQNVRFETSAEAAQAVYDGAAGAGAAEAGHHCSVDSMTQVAQQIPGGPWKHEGTYPPGAKARVDHQKEHSVTVDGAAKTITVRYCGSHIILNCPVTGQQHLFQKTCIADTPPGKPERGKIPAAPGIEPSKKEPFVLRVRKGRSMTTEKGPFALITDAVDVMQQMGAPGETATIYDGSKVASYRGGRAVFVFGRTRWSRA